MNTANTVHGWSCLASLLLLGTTGCGDTGPKTYPVEGVVTRADGKSLAGGRVEFRSDAEATRGLNASSEIGLDGSYRLRTRYEGGQKDGAVVGPHVVIVVPPQDSPASMDQPEPLPLVPLSYRDYEQTPLRFTVEPKANRYPIQIPKP